MSSLRSNYTLYRDTMPLTTLLIVAMVEQKRCLDKKVNDRIFGLLSGKCRMSDHYHEVCVPIMFPHDPFFYNQGHPHPRLPQIL